MTPRQKYLDDKRKALEKEWDRLDAIGMRAEQAAVEQEIEEIENETQRWADHWKKLRKAVESEVSSTVKKIINEEVSPDYEMYGVEDQALDFVEQCVGRYDWRNNWKMLKSKADPTKVIETWLKQYGLQGNAQAIFKFIEELTKRPGAWR